MSLKMLRTVLAITFVTSSICWAADLRVPEVYATLKAAVDVSQAGDRILISQSTTITAITYVYNAITIEKAGSNNVNVYIGEGLEFHNQNKATVRGINFYLGTNFLKKLRVSGATVKFDHCLFFGTNGIELTGTAGSTLELSVCDFYNCGTAINAMNAKNVKIQSCNFIECRSSFNQFGSFDPNVSSSASISFCDFIDHTTNYARAVCVDNSAGITNQPFILNLNYCYFDDIVNPHSITVYTNTNSPATNVNIRYSGWYRADTKTYYGPYQLYELGNYFID